MAIISSFIPTEPRLQKNGWTKMYMPLSLFVHGALK